MEYRVLGNTGVQVSALCLGTMTFGKEADPQASAAIFNRAREAGINFIDCADGYGKGAAEEILGGIISGCRHELVITTKVFSPMSGDINDRGLSRRHIPAAAEASLRRLKTDHIDFYFLHHFDPKTPLEESLRALEELVSQGKALYTGVSNFAAWQVMKAVGICRKEGWNPIQCIQPMYSLVKRQAEVELLPMALSEKIGVISYSPLGAGLLTGKYIDAPSREAGRLNQNPMYQSRYSQSWMHETAKRFREFARENGFEPASLAVAWVLRHPAVTAPIIGARSIEQLEGSLKAVDIDMTSELYSQISGLSPQPPPANDRTEDPATMNR
jgi:aryl-alcohol dehydrogenase-like predicted oxidoreductase